METSGKCWTDPDTQICPKKWECVCQRDPERAEFVLKLRKANAVEHGGLVAHGAIDPRVSLATSRGSRADAGEIPVHAFVPGTMTFFSRVCVLTLEQKS